MTTHTTATAPATAAVPAPARRPNAQLTLLDVHRSAAKILDFSIGFYNPTLLRHLIEVKQLPGFYFLDAAQEMGFTSEDWKNWAIAEWVEHPPALEPALLAEMLIKVLLRIIHYPEAEPYPTAASRLLERYQQLTADGYSHNKLAQYLEITHHQLTRIVRNAGGDTKTRPRHCPWRILELLADAETAINTKPVRPEAEYQVTNVAPDPELPPRPANFRYLSSRQAPCQKCGAPAHNLKADGVNAWGDRVYMCIMCSHNNHLPAKADQPQQPRRL